MTALRARSYQREAIEAIEHDWANGFIRVAAVLATGLGKTHVFAHVIDRAAQEGKRALVLVHREELAEQAKTKIHSVAPHLSIGIVKAARNEVDADVVVGSVQTLANAVRREALLGTIDLVVCDEAHHAVSRTWMEILEAFGCFDSTPCLGVTATMTRNDGKGLGDVWETVAYERDILYGIDNGYLTDVRGQAITVDGLDLATIARSRGDYQEGQLGEALIESGAAEVVAKAYLEHASIPEKWDGAESYGELTVRQGVLFAPTVASAYAFAEALNGYDIPTAVVEGNISTEDRELIYKRYEAGEIRVLANCMVLTEGWDAPWCEVAVIARPTQSAALYTQMVGRVLRPWPGKTDALVLDVVGIAGRHKLQSLVDLVKTSVQEGESYAEARVRLEQEARERVGNPDRVIGAVAAQQVELFANSHSSWLMTKGGRWFIPTKGGLYFLWPALTEEGDTRGTWRVGYVFSNKKHATREPGWIESNLTLEYAMAWGEQLAEEDDPTVSLKDRSWRRKKASEGQIARALRLKIAPIDTLVEYRAGELSDKISVAQASKQLDV